MKWTESLLELVGAPITSYDKDKLKEEHKRLYVTLTEEQKGIYGTIMDSVDKNKGGRIVLNVASSGIAVFLLELVRQTHSSLPYQSMMVEDSMNGKIGGKNDGEANVEFPDDMLIPNSNDHIGSIIYESYPDLLQNLYDLDYFQERAILAPLTS
ncbi:ATP-dependent DNA helicase PIF1-like protein [Tanacetum coccineum]|uniref:ATP-dependent DNA helicase PIF1-like protein n=1 Tax=Tanacetum coccineum TaxID=301880 RepID=A0ABQ4YBT8_9ASTR